MRSSLDAYDKEGVEGIQEQILGGQGFPGP